jgi:ubiquinone/menaquinone biosynthesis C-methylase UbiE
LTSPSDTLLDVGCGTGSILRYLKNCGYTDLHGLEVSGAAIETLSGLGFAMTKGKLPWIPLPDRAFDVVIASQVLEHIVRRRRFVKEIARVLKPGGRLFVFVPDDCLGPIDEPSHVIKYTSDKLKSFLSNYFASVEVRRIRDENFTMPILFASAVTRTSSPPSGADTMSSR